MLAACWRQLPTPSPHRPVSTTFSVTPSVLLPAGLIPSQTQEPRSEGRAGRAARGCRAARPAAAKPVLSSGARTTRILPETVMPVGAAEGVPTAFRSPRPCAPATPGGPRALSHACPRRPRGCGRQCGDALSFEVSGGAPTGTRGAREGRPLTSLAGLLAGPWSLRGEQEPERGQEGRDGQSVRSGRGLEAECSHREEGEWK